MPERDKAFSVSVIQVMNKNPAYGTGRLAIKLKVSGQKVQRIKKKFNLYPLRSKRKPKKRRDLNQEQTQYPNLTKNLLVLNPRTVYASDFTYIPFKGKFVYLATVIDIFSREIVGWQISTRHTASLVKSALLDALQRTGSSPEIIHSDQGSEYRSQEYQKFLAVNEIKPSMSSKSSPWQNGFQESFYGGFKEDLWDTKHYQSLGELTEAIHQTINYYNKERIHTALRMSPQEFFNENQKKSVETKEGLRIA